MAESTYLGTRMCDTDVATRVTFLRKLTGEKLVQFGAEDTIRDKLSLLADLSGHRLRGWEETVYTDVLALVIKRII